MGLDIRAHLARTRHAIQLALDDLEMTHIQIDPARLFDMKILYDPFVDSRNGEQADGRD